MTTQHKIVFQDQIVYDDDTRPTDGNRLQPNLTVKNQRMARPLELAVNHLSKSKKKTQILTSTHVSRMPYLRVALFDKY